MAQSPRFEWILSLSLCLLIGCGDTPNPVGWLGLPSACQRVAEFVNEGTNWVLNKNQVSIAKVTEVRPIDSSTFVADFKIAVTNGKNSFETVAKDVPCDKDGIPTEASVTKLRESVEDIKAKIKRFQN